ncbi:cytochrome P450 [Aspergillus heterothallicus]
MAFSESASPPKYSMTAVLSLEGKIQPVLDTTWDRFDELAKLDQPINLSMWASYFTYDVVGTLCLSEPMGFLRDGGWLLNSVIHKIARLLHLRLTDHSRAFTNFSIDKVIQRMQGGSNKSGDRDMLDHFVDMKGPHGEPAPLGDILAEVGTLLAAGADTTSVAIKAVLGPLLKDPARYSRLQKEGTAQLKEGERLHPSIIYQLPRVAPADGFNIEGYYIPPSATISMSPLAQNRCQAIFGDDADTWRPERWIPKDGIQLK